MRSHRVHRSADPEGVVQSDLEETTATEKPCFYLRYHDLSSVVENDIFIDLMLPWESPIEYLYSPTCWSKGVDINLFFMNRSWFKNITLLYIENTHSTSPLHAHITKVCITTQTTISL